MIKFVNTFQALVALVTLVTIIIFFILLKQIHPKEVLLLIHSFIKLVTTIVGMAELNSEKKWWIYLVFLTLTITLDIVCISMITNYFTKIP